MHLRNADVWLVGALLLLGCALAGYALGQATADHESARAPTDDGRASEASPDTAHGPGALRWLPLVGGIVATPGDTMVSEDRSG